MQYNRCWLLMLPFMVSAQDTIYGKRYCEIISSANFSDFYVYNTYGLNNCPQSWWDKVKSADFQKKYHYKFVHLNGPRLWLIDKIISNQPESEVKIFEGQQLREFASFHPNLSSIMKNHGPYTEHHVIKKYSYKINKGRRVYELITDNNKIYVLQSISLKIKPQSPDNLEAVIASLKLPPRWRYKQGRLTEDKYLKPTHNNIEVIQDEYENTYQLSARDLIQ